MYAIFIEQYNDVLQTGKNELWTSAIKKNLESLGFAYVWLNINDYIDVNMLNRRLRDQYIKLGSKILTICLNYIIMPK